MKVGARVEVRNRFESSWSRGFEIAEIVLDEEHEHDRHHGHDEHDVGYRVLRRSDRTVLPTVFSDDDLREERRRQTWWQ